MEVVDSPGELDSGHKGHFNPTDGICHVEISSGNLNNNGGSGPPKANFDKELQPSDPDFNWETDTENMDPLPQAEKVAVVPKIDILPKKKSPKVPILRDVSNLVKTPLGVNVSSKVNKFRPPERVPVQTKLKVTRKVPPPQSAPYQKKVVTPTTTKPQNSPETDRIDSSRVEAVAEILLERLKEAAKGNLNPPDVPLQRSNDRVLAWLESSKAFIESKPEPEPPNSSSLTVVKKEIRKIPETVTSQSYQDVECGMSCETELLVQDEPRESQNHKVSGELGDCGDCQEELIKLEKVAASVEKIGDEQKSKEVTAGEVLVKKENEVDFEVEVKTKSNPAKDFKEVKKVPVDQEPRWSRHTKKYPCGFPQCRKKHTKFRDQVGLDAHLCKVHEGREEPFKCPACESYFKSRALLRSHSLEEHKGDSSEKSLLHKCPHCHRPFLSPESLRSHSTVKPQVCDMCGVKVCSFGLLNHLKEFHLEAHLSARRAQNQCHLCPKNFLTPTGLKAHLDLHKNPNRPRNFKCTLCGKTFLANQGLRIHEQNTHAEELHLNPDLYKCKECGKVLKSREALKHHGVMIHTKKYRYKCSECGKGYNVPLHFRDHMKSHSEERPEACALCPKKFKTKKSLWYHTLLHKNVRKHKCNVCGKAFMDSGKLKVHKQIHSGLKPYECKICKIKFAVYNYLYCHNRAYHRKAEGNNNNNSDNNQNNNNNKNSNNNTEGKKFVLRKPRKTKYFVEEIPEELKEQLEEKEALEGEIPESERI